MLPGTVSWFFQRNQCGRTQAVYQPCSLDADFRARPRVWHPCQFCSETWNNQQLTSRIRKLIFWHEQVDEFQFPMNRLRLTAKTSGLEDKKGGASLLLPEARHIPDEKFEKSGCEMPKRILDRQCPWEHPRQPEPGSAIRAGEHLRDEIDRVQAW